MVWTLWAPIWKGKELVGSLCGTGEMAYSFCGCAFELVSLELIISTEIRTCCDDKLLLFGWSSTDFYDLWNQAPVCLHNMLWDLWWGLYCWWHFVCLMVKVRSTNCFLSVWAQLPPQINNNWNCYRCVGLGENQNTHLFFSLCLSLLLCVCLVTLLRFKLKK